MLLSTTEVNQYSLYIQQDADTLHPSHHILLLWLPVLIICEPQKELKAVTSGHLEQCLAVGGI